MTCTSGRFPMKASCSRAAKKSCTIALRVRFKCKVEPPSPGPFEWNLLFYDTSLRTFPVHILLRKPFFQVATGPASVRSLLSAHFEPMGAQHAAWVQLIFARVRNLLPLGFRCFFSFQCKRNAIAPGARWRKDSIEINPRSILRIPSVVHRMFVGKGNQHIQAAAVAGLRGMNPQVPIENKQFWVR